MHPRVLDERSTSAQSRTIEFAQKIGERLLVSPELVANLSASDRDCDIQNLLRSEAVADLLQDVESKVAQVFADGEGERSQFDALNAQIADLQKAGGDLYKESTRKTESLEKLQAELDESQAVVNEKAEYVTLLEDENTTLKAKVAELELRKAGSFDAPEPQSEPSTEDAAETTEEKPAATSNKKSGGK